MPNKKYHAVNILGSSHAGNNDEKNKFLTSARKSMHTSNQRQRLSGEATDNSKYFEQFTIIRRELQR